MAPKKLSRTNIQQDQKVDVKNEPGTTETITIEVHKYKSLLDALNNWKKVFRVVFTIFFVGVLLFAGITVITLAIKRVYPYSDITTNGLGTTTIKSEKNEISYWLLNSASLWASTGIQVEEGDIITVRASGKSHTAIHHLYRAAQGNNKDNLEPWVGSEGDLQSMQRESDRNRQQFRIFPELPLGALVMQVCNSGHPADTPREGDPDNFYFIGKERQNIYINHEGILMFAVNDIVLNRPTIANMMLACIRDRQKDNKIDGLLQTLDYSRRYPITKQNVEMYGDTILEEFQNLFKEEIESKAANKPLSLTFMDLGLSPTITDKDSTAYVCELSYYYGADEKENDRRKTAWYDDNVGSFLIIVEKTN